MDDNKPLEPLKGPVKRMWKSMMNKMKDTYDENMNPPEYAPPGDLNPQWPSRFPEFPVFPSRGSMLQMMMPDNVDPNLPPPRI